MNNHTLRQAAAIIAGTTVLALATACGSSDEAPTYPADEQAALTALHNACNENDAQLDTMAGNTVDIFEKNGVTNETKLTVLQHLRDSIPEGTKLDCDKQLVAYVQLRAPGAS